VWISCVRGECSYVAQEVGHTTLFVQWDCEMQWLDAKVEPYISLIGGTLRREGAGGVRAEGRGGAEKVARDIRSGAQGVVGARRRRGWG
jgi:hypothetical protein